MREILKIEKVNTVKALTASLIDLVITIIVGIALFYLAYLPIFKASTTYNESQNYIYSVENNLTNYGLIFNTYSIEG